MVALGGGLFLMSEVPLYPSGEGSGCAPPAVLPAPPAAAGSFKTSRGVGEPCEKSHSPHSIIMICRRAGILTPKQGRSSRTDVS